MKTIYDLRSVAMLIDAEYLDKHSGDPVGTIATLWEEVGAAFKGEGYTLADWQAWTTAKLEPRLYKFKCTAEAWEELPKMSGCVIEGWADITGPFEMTTQDKIRCSEISVDDFLRQRYETGGLSKAEMMEVTSALRDRLPKTLRTTFSPEVDNFASWMIQAVDNARETGADFHEKMYHELLMYCISSMSSTKKYPIKRAEIPFLDGAFPEVDQK